MLEDIVIGISVIVAMVMILVSMMQQLMLIRSKRMIRRLKYDIQDLRNGEDTSIENYVEPDLSEWLGSEG